MKIELEVMLTALPQAFYYFWSPEYMSRTRDNLDAMIWRKQGWNVVFIKYTS